MRKVDDGGEKRLMKIVATTSLPAVDRPNAERWNAACSRQKEKTYDYSGHYVTASSRLPGRRPLERRTLVPKEKEKMAFLVATTSLPAVDARTPTAGTPHTRAKDL